MTATNSQNSNNAVARFDNVAESVLNRVAVFQKEGSLTLPQNYSAANALKSAWLFLTDAKTSDGKPILQVVTKDSIATSLLDMVVQGLSVAKHQGYFIPYGSKLQFSRSYFGTVALAKRVGGIVTEPRANVIYKGDEFVYEINPDTGDTRIVKHVQKIENINDVNITAAYCILTRPDNTHQLTIMTIDQIHKAWNQGATKGNSPAHRNFPAEMCKKTVIGRACKMIINSSDDAWLYEGKADEETPVPAVDEAKAKRDAIVSQDVEAIEVVDDEEQSEQPPTPEPETPQTPSKNTTDEPGY